MRKDLVPEHGVICIQIHGQFDDDLRAYAHGIARNHPFVDGNKRTAYVVCMLFLRLHGVRIDAPGPERVIAFEQLGKGALDREALAGWLRARRK